MSTPTPDKKTIKQLCQDWAEDHTRAQQLALTVGLSRAKVEGDNYGVSGIIELLDMVEKQVTAHLANLNATIALCEDTIKTMNAALKEAHRIFGNLSHSPVVKALCPDFAEVAEIVRKSHDQHA